jgi:hypothetical protein
MLFTLLSGISSALTVCLGIVCLGSEAPHLSVDITISKGRASPTSLSSWRSTLSSQKRFLKSSLWFDYLERVFGLISAQIVAVLHVLLALEEDLPWFVVLFGLIAHWEYFGLLAAYPFVRFPSIPPITSLGLLKFRSCFCSSISVTLS